MQSTFSTENVSKVHLLLFLCILSVSAEYTEWMIGWVGGGLWWLSPTMILRHVLFIHQPAPLPSIFWFSAQRDLVRVEIHKVARLLHRDETRVAASAGVWQIAFVALAAEKWRWVGVCSRKWSRGRRRRLTSYIVCQKSTSGGSRGLMWGWGSNWWWACNRCRTENSPSCLQITQTYQRWRRYPALK